MSAATFEVQDAKGKTHKLPIMTDAELDEFCGRTVRDQEGLQETITYIRHLGSTLSEVANMSAAQRKEFVLRRYGELGVKANGASKKGPAKAEATNGKSTSLIKKAASKAAPPDDDDDDDDDDSASAKTVGAAAKKPAAKKGKAAAKEEEEEETEEEEEEDDEVENDATHEQVLLLHEKLEEQSQQIATLNNHVLELSRFVLEAHALLKFVSPSLLGLKSADLPEMVEEGLGTLIVEADAGEAN